MKTDSETKEKLLEIFERNSDRIRELPFDEEPLLSIYFYKNFQFFISTYHIFEKYLKYESALTRKFHKYILKNVKETFSDYVREIENFLIDFEEEKIKILSRGETTWYTDVLNNHFGFVEFIKENNKKIYIAIRIINNRSDEAKHTEFYIFSIKNNKRTEFWNSTYLAKAELTTSKGKFTIEVRNNVIEIRSIDTPWIWGTIDTILACNVFETESFASVETFLRKYENINNIPGFVSIKAIY